MLKLLVFFLFLSPLTAMATFECGGVSASVFEDIALKLQDLHNSNFLEEGLSFHEYPDLWVSKNESSYDLTIGAGSFDAELVCSRGAFELSTEENSVLVKNFQYRKGKVSGAEVFELTEGGANLVASFTLEGREVVYGALDYFVPASKAHPLARFID